MSLVDGPKTPKFETNTVLKVDHPYWFPLPIVATSIRSCWVAWGYLQGKIRSFENDVLDVTKSYILVQSSDHVITREQVDGREEDTVPVTLVHKYSKQCPDVTPAEFINHNCLQHANHSCFWGTSQEVEALTCTFRASRCCTDVLTWNFFPHTMLNKLYFCMSYYWDSQTYLPGKIKDKYLWRIFCVSDIVVLLYSFKEKILFLSDKKSYQWENNVQSR